MTHITSQSDNCAMERKREASRVIAELADASDAYQRAKQRLLRAEQAANDHIMQIVFAKDREKRPGI